MTSKQRPVCDAPLPDPDHPQRLDGTRKCGKELPPRRRRFCSDVCLRRGRRAGKIIDPGDFGQLVLTMVKQMAKRADAPDITVFGIEWQIRVEAEKASIKRINDLRASGYSWAAIGAEIGWSKQRMEQWHSRRAETRGDAK